MVLIRRLVMLAGLLCAAFAPTAPAIAQMNASQRTEIEGVIKDYLMKHPEVLREALIELERRSKNEEAEKRTQALKDLGPRIFNSKHQVVLGNPKGKIQIAEFFDYNCGYCRRAMTDMMNLMKKNPDLRVVLKEFPVLGPKSVEAALVASALHNQMQGDKYWAFHQRLMLAKGQIGKEQAMAAAKASGADMAKLQKDIDHADTKAGIGEVMQIADSLNLTGTPSYIVGDEIVVGAVGAEQLQTRIDNLRKCGSTKCS